MFFCSVRENLTHHLKILTSYVLLHVSHYRKQVDKCLRSSKVSNSPLSKFLLILSFFFNIFELKLFGLAEYSAFVNFGCQKESYHKILKISATWTVNTIREFLTYLSTNQLLWTHLCFPECFARKWKGKREMVEEQCCS